MKLKRDGFDENWHVARIRRGEIESCIELDELVE
jgi:hypothetical protein